MFKFAVALTALVNATPAIARPTTYTLQVELTQRSRLVVIVKSRRLSPERCGHRAQRLARAYPKGEVICAPE